MGTTEGCFTAQFSKRIHISQKSLRVIPKDHRRDDWPCDLADLVREDKLLWVYCCDCGRERNVTPSTIPLPPETPVPSVSKHMKCSACGSRKVNTEPELH